MPAKSNLLSAKEMLNLPKPWPPKGWTDDLYRPIEGAPPPPKMKPEVSEGAFAASIYEKNTWCPGTVTIGDLESPDDAEMSVRCAPGRDTTYRGYKAKEFTPIPGHKTLYYAVDRFSIYLGVPDYVPYPEFDIAWRSSPEEDEIDIKDIGEGGEISAKRRVKVKLGRGSVMKVAKDSRVKVTKLSTKESALEVLKGKIWSKITKLTVKECPINFYSSYSSTGIRGTEFTLDVNKDGTTKVMVFEGTVEFSDSGKKKTVLVKEGEMSIVKPGGVPSKPEVIDPEKIARWWE